MQPKAMLKMAVDGVMTVLLLLLMAYELVGRAAHEWIGLIMFVLLIAHHILNCGWLKNLRKGRYTPYRVLQTALAGLVLLSMLGQMVSALLISREVFAFLPFTGGVGFGRTLHMLAAYWGFIFLSLHLGLHWGGITGALGRRLKPSRLRENGLWAAGILFALYGVFAFFRRGIGEYLFLRTQFVFFNFDEPLFFFFVDYLAVMALFVCLGFYLGKAARRAG